MRRRSMKRLDALLLPLALIVACSAQESPPVASPARGAGPDPAPAVASALVVEAPACEPLVIEVPALDDSLMAAAEVPLLDPTGRGMAAFYERLARVLRGRAKDHVRVGVYGDSNMVMDFITGPLRRDLQLRYGDAGHGFIALARPWSHYRHMDIVQEIGSAFESYAVTTKPTKDGAYGYSGIVSEGSYPGAKVRLRTAPDSSLVGKTASRFDVFYLKGPRRGAFDVVIDGNKIATLAGEAPQRGVGIYRAEVDDGPHTFDTVVSAPPYIRLLGGVLERKAPSIVIDQLGVGAMNTQCITLEDPAVSLPMLAYRRYDLIILLTGTADIYQLDEAPGYVKQVIELHRAARPEVSFLLVAPPDRGVSHATDNLLTLGAQRKAAASELGVAFWDLLHAMGGPTVMMKFIRKQMALPDQIHFSEIGGAWVGRRLEHALMSSFARFLVEHPRTGCDPDAVIKELEPWPAGPHPN